MEEKEKTVEDFFRRDLNRKKWEGYTAGRIDSVFCMLQEFHVPEEEWPRYLIKHAKMAPERVEAAMRAWYDHDCRVRYELIDLGVFEVHGVPCVLEYDQKQRAYVLRIQMMPWIVTVHEDLEEAEAEMLEIMEKVM